MRMVLLPVWLAALLGGALLSANAEDALPGEKPKARLKFDIRTTKLLRERASVLCQISLFNSGSSDLLIKTLNEIPVVKVFAWREGKPLTAKNQIEMTSLEPAVKDVPGTARLEPRGLKTFSFEGKSPFRSIWPLELGRYRAYAELEVCVDDGRNAMHALKSHTVDFEILPQAAVDPKAVAELLEAIRKELPTGWEATYEADDACLSVTRTAPALQSNTMPNTTPFAPPEQRAVAYAYRISSYLEPGEYDEQQRKHRLTEDRMAMLRTRLVRARTPGKFDSFQPETDEQKALVAEYEALQKSQEPLPEYNYKNRFSLSWSGPPFPALYSGIVDEAVQKECLSVLRGIEKLLWTYPVGVLWFDVNPPKFPPPPNIRIQP